MVGWLVACSKENNVSQDTYSGKSLGPEGGIVEGDDTVELRVPAGALTEETAFDITVAEPSQYPPLSAQYELVGRVYAFTPHGQTFLTPVVVSLPDAGGATTLLRAESGGSWGPITSELIAGRVEAGVTRFSYYAAAHPAEMVTPTGPSCSGRGPDSTAPTGTLSNFSGNVGTVDLSTLVDGFVMSTSGALAIIFTPYERACGHQQNGTYKSGASWINLGTGLSGGLTTTTYPGDASWINREVMDSAVGECMYFATAGSTGTSGPGITIIAADSEHVAGSFDITTSSGRTTGTFDLPICAARSGLEPPECCVN